MARGKAPTFELQRTSIMTAAAQLFGDKGFHNASMAELAQACGVSKPLLYHYYRDKEHILFDIADSYIDRLLEIVAGVEARGLEPEEQLAALLADFMAEYAHSQSRHMVMVQDVKFLGPEQAERVRDKQRQVVAAFAAAVERVEPGLKRRNLDKPIAMVLFGMINWSFTWLRADGSLSYADMAPVVTRIFLRGVRGLAQDVGRRRAGSRAAAGETA